MFGSGALRERGGAQVRLRGPGVSVAVALASVPLSVPALWLTGIERGVMLAGLAVALGGLAARGMSRHYKGTPPGPLPGPWAVRGSLIGAAASAALLVTAVARPRVAARPPPPPP